MLTEFHKANLTKLADYLDSLPSDYAGFDMRLYYGTDVREDEDLVNLEVDYDVPVNPQDILCEDYDPVPHVNECGAAACAIGHGPAAGIPIAQGDHDWPAYARRVFGASVEDGAYGRHMFGVHNPNCPHAAASRIRAVLTGH